MKHEWPATTPLSWYVAQVKPGMSARAVCELEKQGFRAFLPLFLKRRSHARRVSVVPAPLFPGYVFVAFDITHQRWRSVNGTTGVVRLLSTRDTPSSLPDGFMEGLLARREADGFVRLPAKPTPLRGEPVRVAGGSFDAMFGLFEEVTDSDRVTVLLSLLGRKVRVVLDGELVERVA